MRSGKQYLESLRDGRVVYVDAERVNEIPSHPAFRGIAETVAGLYDAASDPSNNMIFTAPETGAPSNKAFMIPRSGDDLRQRREAISQWARQTNGLLGRGPDHVAGFCAGFASAPEVFARGGEAFGQNVTRFYRKLLNEQLYVTYVIIPPQVDRGKTAKDQEEAFLQVGVCGEKDGGIIDAERRCSARPLRFQTTFCAGRIVPLQPGDEDYALSFVAPMDSRGLKLYCRPPYAPGKPSVFDYPLSTRFDETDALVVFDDVFVPWENIFVYRDVGLIRAQFFETPAHVLGNNQAQIRLTIKMKFLLGIARKIAAVNRIDAIPTVQEKLGELASLAAIVEGMALASEATFRMDENGVARPNPRFLYGAMGLQSELYPRALHLLRELAGGGLLQVPSTYKELISPETVPKSSATWGRQAYRRKRESNSSSSPGISWGRNLEDDTSGTRCSTRVRPTWPRATLTATIATKRRLNWSTPCSKATDWTTALSVSSCLRG